MTTATSLRKMEAVGKLHSSSSSSLPDSLSDSKTQAWIEGLARAYVEISDALIANINDPFREVFVNRHYYSQIEKIMKKIPKSIATHHVTARLHILLARCAPSSKFNKQPMRNLFTAVELCSLHTYSHRSERETNRCKHSRLVCAHTVAHNCYV